MQFFNMEVAWTTVALALFVFVLSYCYIYLTWNYGVLEKIGIPVKKTYFCFGSVPLQFFKLQYQDDLEDIGKYGKMWGCYEGKFPVLFVADPDIIKRIFIKDFSYFHSPLVFKSKQPVISEFLIQLHGEKWKMMRSLVSPIFSTKHLKGMSVAVEEKCLELVSHLKENSVNGKSEVNIKSIYDCFIMDIIGNIFFGTRTSALKNPQHDFVVHTRSFFRRFVQPKPVLFLASLFPSLLPWIDVYDRTSIDFLTELSKEFMNSRKKDGGHYDDYIDTLLKIEKELNSEKFKHVKTSKATLLSQGVQFFLANLNTTSTSLTACTILLAKNPQVQEKAYEEINRIAAENNGINRESVSKMVYLAALVDEALRLFPPIVRIQRQCQKDWEFDGLKIPKGTVIKVPVYGMQNHENYFEDSKEFKPERFLNNNNSDEPNFHPYSYMPFATGPRNCVAMNFALEEMRMTLAHLIYNFKIIATPETELQPRPGLLILLELLAIADTKIIFQIRE